ncbi:MAG: class I SAM-dependent methyltransferase [Lysobacteraceae bacterium]|nr:MAG: class I SAM-dependent methyltransferase [Xanthomonadaceae bacterium]
MTDDASNGWEAVARAFIAARSGVGADVVRNWSRSLPTGAAVLDLGCGAGVPVSRVLAEQGCQLHGIDASPTLVEAWRHRFPQAPVACEAAEASAFFDRAFDGIVAIGLLFLLEPAAQRAVIARVAAALVPRGRFLFTAPEQAVRWNDLLTGRASVSLGRDAYRRLLAEAGLQLERESIDGGGNHYFDAVRRRGGAVPSHASVRPLESD